MRLSQPFSYWPIKVGIVLIVLALVMSIVGLHKTEVSYTESGKLTPGFHLLGNSTFEDEHVYADRTLELSSTNSSLVLMWGKSAYPMNLTTNITVKPRGRPGVSVNSGEVDYRYTVVSWRYPYAGLAIPALLSMIAGTVFVFIGYVRFKGGKR